MTLNRLKVLGDVSLNALTSNRDDYDHKSHLPQFTSTFHNNVLEENGSISTRSSQTELSELVKLCGPTGENHLGKLVASTPECNKLNSNYLESKPAVALYIGDLEKSITEEMLKEFFSQYKSLASVKVCTNKTTGKSLGYGYLNFTDEFEANTVLTKYNYTSILGKEVRIMPSVRDSNLRKKIGTNVFFAKLPLIEEKITLRQFYEFFQRYGNILSCKLNRDKNIGFIYFETEETANTVVEYYNNNKLFFGTKIKCNFHYDKDSRLEKEQSQVKNNKTISHYSNSIIELHEPIVEDLSKSVLVKNLPKNATNEEIRLFFKRFGIIKTIKSMTNFNCKFDNEGKDVVIVFEDEINTKKIVQLTDKTLFKKNCISVIMLSNKISANILPQKQQTIVYLTNLSIVCSIEFLNQLCYQQSIKSETIELTSFEKSPLSFKGYIKCATSSDARRLHAYLNDRLIGGSKVQVSWQKTDNGIPIKFFTCNNNMVTINKNPMTEIYRSSLTNKNYNDNFYYPFYNYNQNYYQHPQYNDTQGFYYNNYMPLMNHSNMTPIAHSNNNRIYEKSMTPIVSKNTNQEIKNQKIVFEMLKKQVKKGLRFLKFTEAAKEENLNYITEYLIDVVWRKDYSKLNNFLSLLNANTHFESIVQNQIENATKILGFEKN